MQRKAIHKKHLRGGGGAGVQEKTYGMQKFSRKNISENFADCDSRNILCEHYPLTLCFYMFGGELS